MERNLLWLADLEKVAAVLTGFALGMMTILTIVGWHYRRKGLDHYRSAFQLWDLINIQFDRQYNPIFRDKARKHRLEIDRLMKELRESEEEYDE